jgi:hypothetical protein
MGKTSLLCKFDKLSLIVFIIVTEFVLKILFYCIYKNVFD